ncbi:Calcineurin-like phosphoesterase [Paracoccus haematequi]|uniref:Calcineurin-like phosphoesterase n=1 Tax=Paracoccus haematequi TaxID=2491866 RepID=A0A3S4DWQ2_9RHOB|nr:metallophosphoesterase [Paracoccus haematequi]VDS09089.1 Calcineurin-like phosphoesterase [Paracoccus haematequi]
MTRIVHLSDLHFGFHRAALAEPLLARVNGAGADLVVVTGDVTHRGRRGQYAQAAAFLSRIRAPLMVVPGNHDVPLYNLAVRYLAPYAGFRRAMGRHLTPVRQVGGARVLGLNSVDPFAVQRGIIRKGEIGRLIGGLDPLATNIVALHHPLEHLAQVDKELARRAPQALSRLDRAGAQIVLSGHLHVWATGAMLEQTAHPGVLQIQAGTALCGRLSDRQNEFAVLQIDGPMLTVERHIAPMNEPDFRPPEYEHFSRESGIWVAHQPPETPIVPGATETAFSTA